MPDNPKNAVVWTEIPVTDLERAVRFYSRLLGHEMSIDESGPNPMSVFPSDGVAGHLYPGTPSRGAGPTIHFAVTDGIDAAAERCRAAGGEVTSEPIPLPTGRFVYATDPDGNSIGLFEGSP